MVIYLDLVFILNFAADALALYVTSRLSGVSSTCSRVVLASFIGGVYATVCAIPLTAAAGAVFVQVAAAALMVHIAFGSKKIFLRLLLLFFVLSCAMVGVLIALAQMFTLHGVSKTLHNMNWKVFFLAGGLCYFFLSVVFRGGAAHTVSGEMYAGSLHRNGASVSLNVLLDTGHTLTDPYTGMPVITVWLDAVKGLFSQEEWDILLRLTTEGVSSCCEQLASISPGAFHIIPYRAVGTENGVLLCFSAEKFKINGCDLGKVTASLTTTPLSDGSGTTALWGGDQPWLEERVS